MIIGLFSWTSFEIVEMVPKLLLIFFGGSYWAKMRPNFPSFPHFADLDHKTFKALIVAIL